MAQFNMNLTPEFERDLKRIMKRRGFKHKADAVRAVVKEAATEKKPVAAKDYDWGRLLGIGLGEGYNPNPRFKSDDDLWS